MTGLDAPYIPIFLVRAQAAFESRVTRALCDLVLERLVTDGYPELGVEVQLHLTGATPLRPGANLPTRWKSPLRDDNDHPQTGAEMTYHDPYTHMEEAWNLEANPFPPDAIRHPGQPFSPEVFPDEALDFRRKLVRGAILANRGVGFLWSQGRRSDTGFGKTTLMMETANDINRDLGAEVLERAGMRPERLVPIAAAYANLNNLDNSGLYPVLFGAVVDAATPPQREGNPPRLLDALHAHIVERVGSTQPRKVEDALVSERIRTAPGAAPLRSELVKSFASDGADGVLRFSLVSPMARLRNGLQYLDF